MTQVIAFGFTTALLSLFQPIPSAYAQQLTGPVSQETSGTGTRGRRIENGPHSIPNEILGEEGRANLDPQAAPTDSKTTERSRRVRRTFSIRLFICQLLADPDHVTTKRQHTFSIQRTVIIY
jgi:hypothetical protein